MPVIKLQHAIIYNNKWNLRNIVIALTFATDIRKDCAAISLRKGEVSPNPRSGSNAGVICRIRKIQTMRFKREVNTKR